MAAAPCHVRTPPRLPLGRSDDEVTVDDDRGVVFELSVTHNYEAEANMRLARNLYWARPA